MPSTMSTPVQPPGRRPILVTGAAGFLGSAVVRRLQREGQPVRALVRSTSRLDRLDGLTADLVAGDIRDAAALRAAVDGCQAVIHLAGPSAWPLLDAPDVRPVIVDGTAAVLEAARKTGVPRVVYVSSSAALGPATDDVPRDETDPVLPLDPRRMPYAAAKREAEELCQRAFAAGQDVVVVSPCEVYGPGDRDLVTAGNLLPLLAGPLRPVCRGGTSIAHVDDVAGAVVAALLRGRSGERYLLGGENLTHRRLAELLSEITGRRPLVITLPTFLVRASAWTARRLRLPFPIPIAAVPYVTGYWFLHVDKAERELGATFRSARETLTDVVTWLRSAGHVD